MMIVKMECPSCGGNINDQIQEGMKYMFCKYCGQKMFIDDGVKRSEHYTVKDDVAKIKIIEPPKEGNQKSKSLLLFLLQQNNIQE